MQTNFNEVLVLQQGEYSSVNNSRPTRKKGVTEILEEMKKREVKVQFKREPLIIFHERLIFVQRLLYFSPEVMTAKNVFVHL